MTFQVRNRVKSVRHETYGYVSDVVDGGYMVLWDHWAGPVFEDDRDIELAPFPPLYTCRDCNGPTDHKRSSFGSVYICEDCEKV